MMTMRSITCVPALTHSKWGGVFPEPRPNPIIVSRRGVLKVWLRLCMTTTTQVAYLFGVISVRFSACPRLMTRGGRLQTASERPPTDQLSTAEGKGAGDTHTTERRRAISNVVFPCFPPFDDFLKGYTMLEFRPGSTNETPCTEHTSFETWPHCTTHLSERE